MIDINNKINNLNLPFEYKKFILALIYKMSQERTIEKIYLFGSAVRMIKAASDVDLAVVVNDNAPVSRNYRLGIINQIENTLDQEELPNIPYDIIFFNDSDFERNKSVSVSVVKDIAREGELLYER